MEMGGKPLKLEIRMKLYTVKVAEYRRWLYSLHKEVVKSVSMEIFNPPTRLVLGSPALPVPTLSRLIGLDDLQRFLSPSNFN